MVYKILFFDLDGTLTDPIEGITKSVQYALAKFDIHEDVEKLLPFVGPPLKQSFMTHYGFDEMKARKAVGYYREYFEKQGMYENRVFDKIPELLQTLREVNKALYVVTSKPTYYAKQILMHFGLDQYFAGVIGSEMDLTNTDKAILVKIALSSHPEENRGAFVMIGDKEHDIVGAKANDIASIGVTYGAGSHEEIIGAGPTYIVHSVKELERLLT
jgi:phosphoglycolate phosphatase